MSVSAALGVPLFAVAHVVARGFGSARARYRVYAVTFAAVALDGPLALVVAAVRPAGLAAPVVPPPAPQVAATVGVVAAGVALTLLAELAIDVVILLRIKARASIDPAIRPGARGAAVAASRQVSTPTAVGYLHPRILVPAGLAAQVAAHEWAAILAHERAHLARYDDWSKALQAAVSRLCWFSPGLWLLGARLDLEREHAADERVLEEFDARAYAACLVRLAVDVRHPLPAPAAWTARSHVARRVQRLLEPAAPGSAAQRIAAGAMLAVAVTLGAVTAAAVTPSTRERVAPRTAAIPVVVVPIAAARLPAPAAAPFALVRLPAVRPLSTRTVAIALAPHGRRKRRPAALDPHRTADQGAVAMVVSGAPCRRCVLLRRPVADGPASARPEFVPLASLAPDIPGFEAPHDDQAIGNIFTERP